MTRVLVGHESKSQHVIYHCIGLRSKLVIVDLIQPNDINKLFKEHIKEGCWSCTMSKHYNMFVITSPTK